MVQHSLYYETKPDNINTDLIRPTLISTICNSTNASAMQLELNIVGVSPLLNLFFASSISALLDQHCIKLALTT